MYSYGPLHIAEQKQSDQLEPTYSSSVRIWGVALRTCRKRSTIGRSGERGSGISVLMPRQNDDEMMILKQGGYKYHFQVFDMTRPGMEPSGEHNTHFIITYIYIYILVFYCIYIYIYIINIIIIIIIIIIDLTKTNQFSSSIINLFLIYKN